MKKLLKFFLHFLLLFLLGARLFDPGLSMFQGDEAYFQNTALDILEGKIEIPSAAMTGTMGVPYGPGAIWIYTLIHKVFSDPFAFVWIHIFFHVLGLSLLIHMFWRVERRESKEFYLVSFLLLSSPWLFFYSRIYWDMTWFVFFSSLYVYFLLRAWGTKKDGLWLTLCVLIYAMMLNIHLMSGPLGVGLLALLYFKKKDGTSMPKYAAKVFLCTLPGLFLLLPYLSHLVSVYMGEGFAPSRSGSMFSHIKHPHHFFLQFFTYLSGYKIHYLFRDLPETFALSKQSIYSFWISVVDVPGNAMRIALLFFSGFLFWKKEWFYQMSNLGKISLLFFYSYVVLYFFMGVSLHPHYFLPLYFVPYVLAFEFYRVLQTKKTRAVFVTVCALLFFSNLSLLSVEFRFLGRTLGTKDRFYGPVLREQMDLVRKVCLRTKGDHREWVSLDPAIHQNSLYYIERVEERCLDKESPETKRVRVRFKEEKTYTAELEPGIEL